MLRIRTIAIGVAALAISTGLSFTGPAAQAQTAASTGKPLPLLQFVQQKKAKPAPRAKMAVHVARHRPRAESARKEHSAPRVAEAKPSRLRRHGAAERGSVAQSQALAPTPPSSPSTAVTAMPANVWPASETAALGASPAGPSVDAPSPPVSTEPVVESAPNQIVPNGQVAQGVPPEFANSAGAGSPVQAAKVDSAPAASMPNHSIAEIADAAAKPTAPRPVVHALVVKPSPQKAGPAEPVGSASWIAQVLAALAGAIAAGVVAWLLIRPAAIRV